MFDPFAFAVDVALEQSHPADAVPSGDIATVSSATGALEDATDMRDVTGTERPLPTTYKPASGVLIDAEQTRQLLNESYLPYDGKRRLQAEYLPYD